MNIPNPPVLAVLGSSSGPAAILSDRGLIGSGGRDGGGVSLLSSFAILKLGNKYLLAANSEWQWLDN